MHYVLTTLQKADAQPVTTDVLRSSLVLGTFHQGQGKQSKQL
jgi:hypothetical protein